MKRIIFLDIDGVLNSLNKLIEVYNLTGKSHSGYKYPFDEKCLENLKMIVDATDAYIVITSTWRKDLKGQKTLLEKLKEYGLDERVIGCTPIMGGREEEIETYLRKMKENVDYIVIDDDIVRCDNFIKVNTQTGLTEDEKEIAIKKLLRIDN